MLNEAAHYRESLTAASGMAEQGQRFSGRIVPFVGESGKPPISFAGVYVVTITETEAQHGCNSCAGNVARDAIQKATGVRPEEFV